MANIHPHEILEKVYSLGQCREQDILQQLAQGLPDAYDLFHNLHWSALLSGRQHIGEVDIVVLSPAGHLLLLEVKSGPVIEKPGQLLKDYGGRTKDIGQQVRRQHSAMLDRIQFGHLPQVLIESLLVLPDHQLRSDVLAYPPERVIDASQLADLCLRIQAVFSHMPALGWDERQRWMDFLLGRFQLVPDVTNRVGRVRETYTRLSNGMAHWVPKIHHAQGAFVVQATAGSGKTQLALGLLKDAARQKKRARYVCFNRALADHLAGLAPPQCDVTTFHQICRDHATRSGMALDFAEPSVFERMVERYLADAGHKTPALDLLVLDESQDFEPAWVQALMQALKPEGRLYVMGDPDQQIYAREEFELPQAVHVRCMDNFRSPQRVVQIINELALTDEAVQAHSVFEGEMPGFHLFGASHGQHDKVLSGCLQQLWQDGYRPEQVVVLSYQGIRSAQVFLKQQLAGLSTRAFTGQYDEAGNAIWREGQLLVDSVYRFKGQSMPVVVLCEVDFAALSDKDRHKLFVGLTRAQMRVEVVISERAAQVLLTKSQAQALTT